MDYKPPRVLASDIKTFAPTHTVEGDRRGYLDGDYDETYSGYKSVIIYIQKGLSDYSELIENVARLALNIQKGGGRKYPLIPVSFGQEEELTHEGKYFDLGYINDYLNDTEIAKALMRLSTNKPVNPAIIPELFPKTDKRSLYYGKTEVNEDDLLIIIGKKDQVYFDKRIENKLKKSIQRRILFVEIAEDKINWIFRKYQPNFINKNEIMENKNTRTENFKLGEFHGKLNPEKSDSEAKLRNDIFLIGAIGLVWSNKVTTRIKILAKEMPLIQDQNRGECIDLFGIDKNWIPYIIELKLKNSTERITDAVNQVLNYEKLFKAIKDNIEVEMRDKLFYENFNFKGEPQKVILSESEFFEGIDPISTNYRNAKDLYMCTFYKTADIKNKNGYIDLIDRRGNTGIVNLGIRNK